MRGWLLLIAVCVMPAQEIQFPQDLFALTLTVTDEKFQPIADAQVSLDTKLLGYTDRDGKGELRELCSTRRNATPQ